MGDHAGERKKIKRRRAPEHSQEDLWPKRPNNRRSIEDVSEDCSTGTSDVEADGFCGYRALALQILGNQDKHMKLKERMLSHLHRNHDFYLDCLFNGRINVMKNTIERLEYGSTPETAHIKSCGRDYYSEGTIDAQIAADAYTTPIAIFDTRPEWPSVMYLPLTVPSEDNPQPQPVNLLPLSQIGHFVVIDLIPSRACHLEWPAVKPYHEKLWQYLGCSKDYNAT
ncbi:hypothetical protein BJV82DRAFT_716179 [Fennellomyces sp. T-0311]|nr:hypothetical protein BJV82DRAFT_716179 [Fennellomyces sp. T-0311]